ncbi:hypothetical protein FRC09_011805 [Ceratobasidium sp. 395]|nr:hypothetical protein FRC09_011805 [Ceratobasidium sp. 395]
MGYNYRRVWFFGLARFLGYPALASTLALRLARAGLDPSSPGIWLLDSKLFLAGLYILAVPAFWSVRNVIKNARREREAKQMGAKTVPWVKGKWPGNVDIMMRMVTSLHGGYVGEVWLELVEQYGLTFNMRILWDDLIVTLDHEIVKYILATGFTHFGKGAKQQARLESFLGDGIFNRDGELWKFHRAMTRPFFARERISDFDLYERYTQKLLGRVMEHADRGVAIDIQDLFARLTMDAAGEFLFSAPDINSLDGKLPIAGQAKIGPRGTAVETTYGNFVNAFDEVQVLIPVRGRMGLYVWPVVEMRGDKAMGYRSVVDRWVQPLLDSAFERRKKWVVGGGDEKAPAGDTFLDDLVSSTDDRTLIADELVNILLAARDTTASLLTFTTYLLTQHPDVLSKLRAEVLEHVGPNAAPTYEQLKGMKYMRAVLNETLRLFPPVPINERSTNDRPVVVPSSSGPLYIPGPNVQVLYPLVHMQRRTDLWGEDGEEFDPDRWLDDRVKTFVADPMRFVPFNAGPRICLGQQFALNEASFVMTRLVQRFDGFALAMEAAPEGCIPPATWAGAKGRKGIEKIWPKNAVTLYSKGGMWVKAHKASEGDMTGDL